jgi:hypothetical protein
MSARSAVSLSTRLKNTIRDARAFHAGLQVWFAAPGFWTNLTNSENEIALGQRVLCLADDLQSLEKAELPVQARIGINSLRSLFDSLIKQWKWDRVSSIDGDEFISEAWGLWTDRRRLYLSAVRSYVEAYAAGETNDRPDEGYFYTAKDAENEGIPPSVPFIRSKEDLKALQEAWIFSPYLGPEFPKRTPDDLAILTTALQDIEEGIRGTPLESSDSEPAGTAATGGACKLPAVPPLGTANPPSSDTATGCSSQAQNDGRQNMVRRRRRRRRRRRSQAQNDERQNMVRDQVFISYSRKEQKFLDDLLTHLKPYLRKGTFKAWSDEQIKPGSQWLDEIKAALARTSVAVMLVSPDFLDSDFIHEHELGPLLKEAAAGGVTILWALIRDCSYEETPLKDYQAVVSPPGKPLASIPKAKRDTAWKAVCKAIKEAVNRP